MTIDYNGYQLIQGDYSGQITVLNPSGNKILIDKRSRKISENTALKLLEGCERFEQVLREWVRA